MKKKARNGQNGSKWDQNGPGMGPEWDWNGTGMGPGRAQNGLFLEKQRYNDMTHLQGRP